MAMRCSLASTPGGKVCAHAQGSRSLQVRAVAGGGVDGGSVGLLRPSSTPF